MKAMKEFMKAIFLSCLNDTKQLLLQLSQPNSGEAQSWFEIRRQSEYQSFDV